MHIYDTHAHIDHLENINDAMRNACEANVAAIVVPSMDLNSCRKNLELKSVIQNPKIYIGMGMHPSETSMQDLDAIVNLIYAEQRQLTAIGEIGLDFWYKWVSKDDKKKEEQAIVYQRFLEVARELDLPAIIHSRGAWRKCFEMAQSAGVSKAEFHWYSGPLDVLKDILDAGYYVSTSPSVASSPQSREAMVFAPIEQSLIETDSPVYYRNRNTDEGFKAEPKDVWKTLYAYAELKGMDPEQALNILNQNACDFFGIEQE